MSLHVDVMRKIDYFLGVPLTFFATLVDRILPKRRSSQIRRVLFIELSEMGSAVLANPAMKKAQQKNCEIFFLIFARNKGSLALLGTVKEKNIFTLRDHSLFALVIDSMRFIFWSHAKRIDACIDLELFSRATVLLSFLSRSRYRVGFHQFHAEGLYRGNLLTHKVFYNSYLHITKNFLALVNSLFIDHLTLPLLKEPILEDEARLEQAIVSIQEIETVRTILTLTIIGYTPQIPIILLNPGVGDFLPQRKWPEEHFVELAKIILQDHPDHLILITGTTAEFATNQKFVEKINHPQVHNFSGKVSLKQLLALYHLSKVLVTSDSGPAHFSSLTPIASFVLYGPETPVLYGPLGRKSVTFYSGLTCSPCVSAMNHRKTPCLDNKCLQVISPRTVYEKMRPVLSS